MKNALRVLLHMLFPERSDAKIVASLSLSSFANYIPRRKPELVSLLPFSDTRVRACVHEVKFHKNTTAVAILAAVLRAYLDTKTPTLIIPIPLSSSRQKERGYNQVALIARHALKHTAHTIDEEIIYRAKDSVPQTTLSRTDRIKNMQHAFAVYDHKRAHEKIKGADIILVDDVSTTGATLGAAKAALLPHSPASITLLALAH